MLIYRKNLISLKYECHRIVVSTNFVIITITIDVVVVIKIE